MFMTSVRSAGSARSSIPPAHAPCISGHSVWRCSTTVLDFLTSSLIPAAKHAVEDDYNHIEEPDRVSAIYFVNTASGQRVQPVIQRINKQECGVSTLDIDQHYGQYRHRNMASSGKIFAER